MGVRFDGSTILRLADALIAATALLYNLRLATRNLQHFTPIEGLQVEKPIRLTLKSTSSSTTIAMMRYSA